MTSNVSNPLKNASPHPRRLCVRQRFVVATHATDSTHFLTTLARHAGLTNTSGTRLIRRVADVWRPSQVATRFLASCPPVYWCVDALLRLLFDGYLHASSSRFGLVRLGLGFVSRAVSEHPQAT